MEPVDESKSSIVLGSAVVISKHAYAQEWTLSATNQKLPKSRDNDVAIVCPCPLDEAVGLSLALNKPIYTTNTIYESLSVDAKLVQMGGREGGMNDMNEQKLTIYAEQKRVTSPAPSQQYDNREKDKISRADVKAAWEIFDPRTFLTMTVAQKRETLRVSGVTNLPRPREGEAELDRMLLDLADDAVRREVFRLKEQNIKQAKQNKNRFEALDWKQGIEDGDTYDSLESETDISAMSKDSVASVTPPSATISNKADRQTLLSQIALALEKGNMDEAQTLSEAFAKKTILRADHTQPEGAYSRFLDQDDWYMEARKKAMAPKK
eukprot:gene2509-3023_t